MKVRGKEPPLDGYTDRDAIKWCIDAIHECLPAAERLVSPWRSKTTGD